MKLTSQEPATDSSRQRKYLEAHREKVNARKRKYYALHKEEIKRSHREYYATHREEVKARNRKHDVENRPARRATVRRSMAKRRERALLMIAQHHGDVSPRCRVDLLPDGHPLKKHECFGVLEIDHINGGGKGDHFTGTNLIRAITNGRRLVSDLRLLCRLHQLWNVERQLGRPRKDEETQQ